MKMINKGILVVCHLYTTSLGEPLLPIEIAAFVLFIGTGFTRIFIIPHYSKLIDWLTRLTELLSASLLLLLILAQSLKHDLKICLIVAIVLMPGVVVSAFLADNFR